MASAFISQFFKRKRGIPTYKLEVGEDYYFDIVEKTILDILVMNF